MIFGSNEPSGEPQSRLLHVEVLPVMAPGGCPVTAQLAETYLLPAIPGGERVAYVCHTALRDRELAELQREAAARNAAIAATRAQRHTE